MADKLDLHQLQREVNLAYAEDGLAELLAGLLLCMTAGWLVLDFGAWGGITPVLVLMLVASLRRGIRYPRVGYMRPAATLAPGPGRAVLSVLIIAVVLAVLCWLAWRGAASLALPRAVMQLVLGVASILVLAGTGVYLGLGRWFAYAGLVAAGITIALLAGVPAGYGVLAAGVLLVLWSLTLIIRFIRKYPVLGRGCSDVYQRTVPGARG